MSKDNKAVNKYVKVGLLAMFVFVIFQALEGEALAFFNNLELFYYWLIYAYICFNICFNYLIRLNMKESKMELEKYKKNKYIFNEIIKTLKDLNAAANGIILKDDPAVAIENIVQATAAAQYYLTEHMDFPNKTIIPDIVKRMQVNIVWYNKYINEHEPEEKIKEVGGYIITDIKYLIDAIYSSKVVYK